MSFELLDWLSLPGDPAKANEDGLAHGPKAALVLDGATPLGEALMPGPSDAAWLAQFGARRLMAHLQEGDGARKALRAALSDAQKSFEALRRHPPQEMWQTPCASMMLAVEVEPGPLQLKSDPLVAKPGVTGLRTRKPDKGSEIEFLWFGDCGGLLKQGEVATMVVGQTFDKRAAEARRAADIAKEKKLSPASNLSRPEILGPLRANRNQINSGLQWLFSPDPRAAAHVTRKKVKVAWGTVLLLATDGFLALASDYGSYDCNSLMAAAMDRGLSELGRQLRAIEAEDQGGDKFPRFKKSDDATALLLKLV
jgi:hypothetical protein